MRNQVLQSKGLKQVLDDAHAPMADDGASQLLPKLSDLQNQLHAIVFFFAQPRGKQLAFIAKM